MNSETPTEKSIFFDALDITTTSERDAFVEAACGGDPELLASVSDLLREHDRENNPLDKPLMSRALEHAHLEPGVRIGPYHLLEQIGEGGFGLVFVADQEEPVRRRVALKVIKPGMESREVLARFEAERQAIALMDHPNIARIFDAGVTESAQPYFVMELVRGVPLIEFCDQHQLDLPERLELFVTICHAVQHAHQKGIIHRDLKPSNILVTLQDGRPLAKVIDFGIAKAIGQSLTVKTIYTRFASMVGTPAYMSPEQAEMSAGDVDTRSDIYSLGVLLYELLTGSPPFEPDRLQSAGFDELRRIIREEEPPRPSTRLSTLNNERASTAEVVRRVDPVGLVSSIEGDLDWIVMKALDKDRNRRYSMAAALAQDVSRYLSDQTVEARPPSAWYRFSKFARRNKVALGTASMVAGALILGSAVSLWQASVAIRERDEKSLALKQARAAEEAANEAHSKLEQFSDRLNRSTVLLASGRTHADAERWADAYRAYTEATRVQPKHYVVWLERARLQAKLGRWTESAADFARAFETGAVANGSELSGVPQLLLFGGQEKAYALLRNRLEIVDLEEDPFAVAIRGRLVWAVSPSDASALAQRIERGLDASDSDKSPSRKHKYRHMLYGVHLYIAGWAHLRAGDLDKALRRLEESNGATWLGRGIAHPLIAIAQHKKGRGDEALRSLQRSQAFLDRMADESVSKSRGSPPIPWIDWIEFLMNHRQASILVKGHTPVPDPRLRRMEAFAEAAIVD